MKYIYINDSQGNQNLWQITSETDNGYNIKRCETADFIFKALCQETDKSNVLTTDIIIDFVPTKVKYKRQFIIDGDLIIRQENEDFDFELDFEEWYWDYITEDDGGQIS